MITVETTEKLQFSPREISKKPTIPSKIMHNPATQQTDFAADEACMQHCYLQFAVNTNPVNEQLISWKEHFADRLQLIQEEILMYITQRHVHPDEMVIHCASYNACRQQ